MVHRIRFSESCGLKKLVCQEIQNFSAMGFIECNKIKSLAFEVLALLDTPLCNKLKLLAPMALLPRYTLVAILNC